MLLHESPEQLEIRARHIAQPLQDRGRVRQRVRTDRLGER